MTMNQPQQEPSNYGSPPYGVSQQNPDGPSDPRGQGSSYPFLPPRRKSRQPSRLLILVVVIILLVLSASIAVFVYTDSIRATQASGTATAQAQLRSTTQAQLQVTAQAHGTATAQAQFATATVQAQTTATAIAIGPPIDFHVNNLQDNQVIHKQDIPLTIQGTYSNEGSGHVWVLLEDSLKQFYLQNPPVQFLSGGQWTVGNIRPTGGITTINFVYVTADGNAYFQKQVTDGNFKAFQTLPAGSIILQPTYSIDTSQLSS